MKSIIEHIRVDDIVIDSGDLFAIMDPVWYSVDIYDGESEYKGSLARFSRQQQLILGILWYQAEVNNGGHDQFYFNSTGIVWREALAGLEALRLPEFVAILKESASYLGGEPDADRTTRQKQLEKYKPDFEQLDTRFYRLDRDGDLDKAMQQYISGHRKAFWFEGEVRKPTIE